VNKKIIVVMPAFNAAKTLEITYTDLPHEKVDSVILVDDGSSDETLAIARKLNLKAFVHSQNYGYGANQKTCYIEALKDQATIIVMVHPDYQYDPKLLPDIVKPIEDGVADVVFGSRMMGESAYSQGMPWWKFFANKFLTQMENWVFNLDLSEYHTGYRAYNRKALESVNFLANSDGFIFDQEIVAQLVACNFNIVDVPVPVRYFPEASSASFIDSSIYGLKILALLGRVVLHKYKLFNNSKLTNIHQRYNEVK